MPQCLTATCWNREHGYYQSVHDKCNLSKQGDWSPAACLLEVLARMYILPTMPDDTLLNWRPACIAVAASRVATHLKELKHISIFLPRDAMLARYWLSSCVRPSVRPSVCLSVTSRSCTKMAKPRIRLTTPYDSPETLVFRRQKSWWNSHDITPNRGAK